MHYQTRGVKFRHSQYSRGEDTNSQHCSQQLMGTLASLVYHIDNTEKITKLETKATTT